jgi:hypothetical protein
MPSIIATRVLNLNVKLKSIFTRGIYNTLDDKIIKLLQ